MTPLATDPTPDWNPRWSPDGKEIAFYSYRAGSRDIWVMPSRGAIVATTLWVAYMTRFDGSLPTIYQKQFIIVLPFAVSLYVGINFLSGLYNRVWRFFGLRDAAAMAICVSSAALVSGVWRLAYSGTAGDRNVHVMSGRVE